MEIREYIKLIDMNIYIMNEYRFPFSYQLELLGGINTEERGLFAMKYDKEIREEQNELISNIFHRGATFGRDGAKKIHVYGRNDL